MQWNAALLNTLIAPGISSFTAADIPELTGQFPQAEHWLVNHFLNRAIRGSFNEGVHQVVLNYLRRAHHAYVAYHNARKLTYDYLNGNDPLNPRIRRYYDTLSVWETYALQVSMALDLFKWINGGQGAFDKNDGSKEQRLYTIANQVKHTSLCVDSAQCSVNDTVPLWLSNDGLHSFGIVVSYEEAFAVLNDIARLADELQDPLTFAQVPDNQNQSVLEE